MKKQLIKVLIFGVIIILIISIIFLIGNPTGPSLYNKPIKIVTKEDTGSFIEVYNYKNRFLLFNGWETILDYDKKDRVLGTNHYKEIINLNGKDYTLQYVENRILLESKKESITKGFFFKETDFKKLEEEDYITKVYWYNQNKDPSKIGYIFTIPKNKPYFKVQLFAETKDNTKLKQAGYGLRINNYNIYLSNETILTNDYNEIITDKPKNIILNGEEQDINDPLFKDIKKEISIKLRGTNYKTKLSKPYQIFYNNQNIILIFADKIDYIDNLFKWEVFVPYTSKKEKDNTFIPLYIAFIKDATLTYKNNSWFIESKQFTGNIENYIKEIKNGL